MSAAHADDSCIHNLRGYYERVKQRAAEHKLPDIAPAAELDTRKKAIDAVETQKDAIREINVSLLGELTLYKEYFEEVEATVKGKPLGKVYRLKKVQALVEDVTKVVDDLRKLLKNEESLEIAGAYRELLEDFVDFHEKTNPTWIEKKVNAHKFYLSDKTTLFDFIDMLIREHGSDRGFLKTSNSVEKWSITNFFWKLLRVSPASRKYIISETKRYYRKRFIAVTTGLPATLMYQGIPTAIVIAIPLMLTYYSHQESTVEVVQQQIQEKEVEEKLAMSGAQRDELKRSILMLKAQNESFKEAIENHASMAADDWKVFNDKYVDMSKLLAKWNGADRLSYDPTTRGLIDSFVKEVKGRSYIEGPGPDNQSKDSRLGKALANQSLLLALLSGQETSKDDLKKEMQFVVNYQEFNSSFLAQSILVAEILETAINSIPIEAEVPATEAK